MKRDDRVEEDVKSEGKDESAGAEVSTYCVVPIILIFWTNTYRKLESMRFMPRTFPCSSITFCLLSGLTYGDMMRVR